MYKLHSLTVEQVSGREDTRLKIFDYYGTEAKVTDYAILKNAFIYNNNTGKWWVDSDYDSDNIANFYGLDGYLGFGIKNDCSFCIRPAIKYSDISDMCFNKRITGPGILEARVGSYPNFAVSKSLQNKLFRLYQQGFLFPVDYKSMDARDKNNLIFDFLAYKEPVFVYNNERYVLATAKQSSLLSNGCRYKKGDKVWVKETPINLLIDLKHDTAVFKDLIVAGIPYTNHKQYINNYLSNELGIDKPKTYLKRKS